MSGPQPKVCVVGSVNMDLVVRCRALPRPGETVLGGSYRTYPGGKGANQAVAAARMGAAVTLIGAAGDDANGAELRRILTNEQIDTSRLLVRSGASTGLAMITVADGGENTIVVDPGANGSLTPEEVRAHAAPIEASDVLLMQLEVPIACVTAAATIARSAGRAVLLSAAPARPLPAELLRLIDVLIVNRPEAATLAGMDPSIEPARLALRLAESGITAVVLTLGGQGALIAYRNRPRRIRAFTVKAVDSVGAGDAFAGALAFGWPAVHDALRRKSPDDFTLAANALVTASAAGALATTRPGAIPSLPRREEVEALLAQQPEESR